MHQFFKTFIISGSLLIILALAFLPALALAQSGSNTSGFNTVSEPDLFFDFGAGNIFAGGRSCEGDTCEIAWIGQYIGAVYQFGVGLAAILAVVMMMVGGFIWLSAAGNSERVKTGQSFVWSSLAGLVIALFSFVILNTLNPRLTNLDPLKIKIIEKQELPGPTNFGRCCVCRTNFSSGGAPGNSSTVSCFNFNQESSCDLKSQQLNEQDGPFASSGCSTESTACINISSCQQSITSIFDGSVESYIQSNEGLRLQEYEDPEGSGNCSIGYGHALGPCQTPPRIITPEQANEYFKQDFGIAIGDAESFAGSDYSGLHPRRKMVLVDMAYNLGGPKLNGFVKLKAAINQQDFNKAADEILDSNYAEQTKSRADRNAAIMRNP